MVSMKQLQPVKTKQKVYTKPRKSHKQKLSVVDGYSECMNSMLSFNSHTPVPKTSQL